MEWIETTGRTVDDAVEVALDELGVDLEELEYEVVQAPKGGLFGRLGGSDARIRARVRPISREKPDTRRRRPRNEKRGPKKGGSAQGGGQGGGAKRAATPAAPATDAVQDRADGAADEASSGEETGSNGTRRRRRGGRGRGRATSAGSEGALVETRDPAADAAAVEAAADFVDGLVEAFGLDGEAEARQVDEQWTIAVEGDDLGALIGPRAATLDAITELARTVVHKTADGPGPKVQVDVGGYRAARRASLEEFTRSLAAKAAETGRAQALEPMNSADRKVVHDTVNEIEGVRTTSEGEDSRRRVVILPE